MNLDTFLGIASLVAAVVLFVGYRYFSGIVYIKSKYQRGRYIKCKDQRVGGSRHG